MIKQKIYILCMFKFSFINIFQQSNMNYVYLIRLYYFYEINMNGYTKITASLPERGKVFTEASQKRRNH